MKGPGQPGSITSYNNAIMKVRYVVLLLGVSSLLKLDKDVMSHLDHIYALNPDMIKI